MTSKPTLNSISVIYNPKSPPAGVAPVTLPPPVKLLTSRVPSSDRPTSRTSHCKPFTNSHWSPVSEIYFSSVLLMHIHFTTVNYLKGYVCATRSHSQSV